MKTTPLKEVKPGQSYHCGLASRVKYMLDRYGGHLTPEMYHILKFLINTDGLPVVYVLDHLFYILAEGVLDRCWRFTKSSCWQCVDKINDVFYSSSVLSERAKSNQTTL